ncbi:hypothetical protein ABIE61_003351 [Marinobacterium sp. MBR-111]|jgi:hypothetical protein
MSITFKKHELCSGVYHVLVKKNDEIIAEARTIKCDEIEGNFVDLYYCTERKMRNKLIFKLEKI